MSADHPFDGDADTCDRLLDKAADIHCDRLRSEHPPAQVVESVDLMAELKSALATRGVTDVTKPPAQVVEATCRHWDDGEHRFPPGPMPGRCFCGADRPPAPTDPARKPADEDEAAARALAEKITKSMWDAPSWSAMEAAALPYATALLAAEEAMAAIVKHEVEVAAGNTVKIRPWFADLCAALATIKELLP